MRSKLYFNTFAAEVEKTLRNVVRAAFPRNWDEDFITRTVLSRLVEWESPTHIHGCERPIHVSWDAYKLKGNLERAHGDIGVLVRMTSWEGESFEGAGLLEAKRRYEGKLTFDALKHDQLSRITTETPHSFVLFYDYADITGFSDNIVPWKRTDNRDFQSTLYTNSVVVPSHTVTSVKKRCTSLYKFALPFSYQLCARYMRGFDLDSNERTVAALKGFAADLGGPRYVLVINVSSSVRDQRGGGADPEKTLGPSVNRKEYSPLRKQRPPGKRDRR